MAFDQQPATAELRSRFVDGFVKGFALRNYRFKQALRVIRRGDWKDEFYREDPDDLEAGLNRDIQGIPRNANFPQAFVKWEKIEAIMRKYGLEQNIPWEDSISSKIDVDRRVLLRIARGVVKSVDDGIRATIVADTDIHTITIPAGYEWNTASASIADNLEEAEQKIAEKDYPTENLWVYVNPRDKRSVMKFLFDRGAQIPRLGDKTLSSSNGKLGQLGNKTFIVSNSVNASESIVLVPKMAGDWGELWPLTTYVNSDPGKSTLVRAWEVGVTRITDPKVIVHIKNTLSS